MENETPGTDPARFTDTPKFSLLSDEDAAAVIQADVIHHANAALRKYPDQKEKILVAANMRLRKAGIEKDVYVENGIIK